MNGYFRTLERIYERSHGFGYRVGLRLGEYLYGPATPEARLARYARQREQIAVVEEHLTGIEEVIRVEEDRRETVTRQGESTGQEDASINDPTLQILREITQTNREIVRALGESTASDSELNTAMLRWTRIAGVCAVISAVLAVAAIATALAFD